jgi:hypothetical protein
MGLLNQEMQMTVIDPSEAIAETELVKAAETVTEIESDEIAAETRSRERPTATRMELLQVIMAVHMEVQRVGVEAEVEMMTADTHVATETALVRPAAEMEIFTEVSVACAHGLGVPTETFTVQEIAGIAMMPMLLQETTAETETNVARAEVPSEKVRLH